MYDEQPNLPTQRIDSGAAKGTTIKDSRTKHLVEQCTQVAYTKTFPSTQVSPPVPHWLSNYGVSIFSAADLAVLTITILLA